MNIDDYIEQLQKTQEQAKRLSEALELGVCVSREEIKDGPEYWHLDCYEWRGDNESQFVYDFNTVDELTRYMQAMEMGARLFKKEEI